MKKVLAWVPVLALACGGKAPPPAMEPAQTSDASIEPAVAPAPASAAAPTAASMDASAPAPAAAPEAAAPPADAADAGPSFDMSVVEGVWKEHKEAVRAKCWVPSKSTEKAYIGTMTIRLGPAGKVISTQTEGTDPAASKCIDKEAKGWKFPPPNGTASIKLPIRLKRD